MSEVFEGSVDGPAENELESARWVGRRARRNRVGAAGAAALAATLVLAPLATGASTASASTAAKTSASGGLFPLPLPISLPPIGSLTGSVIKAIDWLASGGPLWGDAAADKASTVNGQYSPGADPGSLYTVTTAIGARRTWAQLDSSGRSITGQGVGVAVVDSGVSKIAGLDTAGKLSYGPDLSIESNGALNDTDTFGHGTHLAGIIGARDGSEKSSALSTAGPDTQLGVAPDAQLEALKLATTDGSADVSQVIAALDWVTQHPTTANGTPIRVINLSYGTDSVQAYQVDPLTAAVENAWRHGIVVVVSGGNEGQKAGRLTDPASDPFVLSVGASDSRGAVSGWSAPSVASFSNSGNAQRHVDLLAPGRSIVSLRDPGSFVDVNHPEGLVAADTSKRLFRGSGTSQAAAVVSGAAALLLQAFPSLTPDQVKYVLTTSAKRVNDSAVNAGAGQLDVAAALSAARTLLGPLGTLTRPNAVQKWTPATGTGSLEQARGGNNLVDSNGTVLSGETDVQGLPWNGKTWFSATSRLASWQGGTWNGATWTGTGWTVDSKWNAARWSAARWSAARWSSSNWDAARWSAARWSAARWSAADWDAARWSAARWN